jgi:hypothetical protein
MTLRKIYEGEREGFWEQDWQLVTDYSTGQGQMFKKKESVNSYLCEGGRKYFDSEEDRLFDFEERRYGSSGTNAFVQEERKHNIIDNIGVKFSFNQEFDQCENAHNFHNRKMASPEHHQRDEAIR